MQKPLSDYITDTGTNLKLQNGIQTIQNHWRIRDESSLDSKTTIKRGKKN